MKPSAQSFFAPGIFIRDDPPKGKGKSKARDPSPSPTSPSFSSISVPTSTPTSPPVTRDSLSLLLERWLSIQEPVAHVSFARELANYMQDELLSGKLDTETEEIVTTVLAKVISFMDERQDDLDRAASLSAPGSSGISMPSTKEAWSAEGPSDRSALITPAPMDASATFNVEPASATE